MKTKILSQLILVFALVAMVLTFQSNQDGIFNNGSTCGTCHGNANNATIVSLNGAPTSFEYGQTYSLSITVDNAISPKAGFNILASTGTFTAGSDSKANGSKNQLTHNAPKSAVSGTTTFNFSWTAPMTGNSVTFDYVGNAVNDDNFGTSADQWNLNSSVFPLGAPTNVQEVAQQKLRFYPNPTENLLTVIGTNGSDAKFYLSNISGQKVDCQITKGKERCIIDCSNLTAGLYILHIRKGNDMEAFKFEVK